MLFLDIFTYFLIFMDIIGYTVKNLKLSGYPEHRVSRTPNIHIVTYQIGSDN